MKFVSEETRRKMSESAKKRCTQEWRKKKSLSYSTPLDTALIKKLYSDGFTQDEIAMQLGTTQKVIWKHMKNHGISARIACKRDQRGDKNHMWKGEHASYKAFHQRLAYALGTAKDLGCAICGITDPGISYDWANLTGKYHDVTDYLPMCRSCHRKYDKARGGAPAGLPDLPGDCGDRKGGERMSHTPGPWKVTVNPTRGLLVKGPNADVIMRHSLSKNWRRNQELYATARLIAAAPELLEELREMLEYARILRSFYIDDEDLRGKGTMIEEDIERAEALLRRVKEGGA